MQTERGEKGRYILPGTRLAEVTVHEEPLTYLQGPSTSTSS